MDPVGAFVRATFLLVLSYGCYSDLRTRRVWSHLWWPHIAAGLYLTFPLGALVALALGGAGLLLNRLGQMGLADVKAVVAFSVLFPDSAPAALAVSLVVAGLWTRFDEDVPYLVPLAVGLAVALPFRFAF
jgi:Flp pilus assembly protein protease CpaA